MKNKKVLVVGAVAAVAVIALACFSLFNMNKGENVEKPVWVANDFTFNEGDEGPIAIDFRDGELGFKDDLVKLPVKESYLVFMTRDGSSHVYTAIIPGSYGAYGTFSSFIQNFSSEPMSFYFTDEDQLKKFEEGVNSDKNVKKRVEGKNVFYYVPGHLVGDYWPYSAALENTDSYLTSQAYKKAFVLGEGYPTEYIRKYGDINSLKGYFGINFNDKFWDDVNYQSRIRCNKVDGSSFVYLTPARSNIISGFPMIDMFFVNGLNQQCSIEDLDELLQKNGFQSIEEAIRQKKFVPEDQIEEASESWYMNEG